MEEEEFQTHSEKILRIFRKISPHKCSTKADKAGVEAWISASPRPSVEYSFTSQSVADRFGEVGKRSGVSIVLEQSESCSVLRLEGAIDIAAAAELKQMLLKALEPAVQAASNEVCLSLEGATDLDVTAVQLLYAARCRAKASGVEWLIDADVPEQLLCALNETGLQQYLVPVDDR